jgi:hypothetical protein
MSLKRPYPFSVKTLWSQRYLFDFAISDSTEPLHFLNEIAPDRQDSHRSCSEKSGIPKRLKNREYSGASKLRRETEERKKS